MVDSKGDARDMSVRRIAEPQGVPHGCLAKVFARPSRAGLVRSTEGRDDGFQLAKPTEHTMVLDAVNTIDDNKCIFECRETRQRLAVFEKRPLEQAREGTCSVRPIMDMAQQRMEGVFGQYMILDLAHKMYRKAPDAFVVEVQEWIDTRKGQRAKMPDSARRPGMSNIGQTEVTAAIRH